MNTNYKTGLSSKDVLYSRKRYGSNAFYKKRRASIFKLFIESLDDPIIKILLFALGIKILLIFDKTDIYETVGIAIAVFLASLISVISEYGSEKAFEKLNEENNSINSKVLRDSKKLLIRSEEIVVGDIVYLESGDRIPCDGKIIDGEIDVDESMLSGETKEKTLRINDNVYMGSVVCSKRAVIICTKVGNDTYYGSIANDIQEKKIESPLKYRLRDLAKTISLFGYIGAILVFISYMLNFVLNTNNITKGLLLSNILYALTLSVAVIVMSVPEGLPSMLTLVLSTNMKKLLKRNVLVRKLVGIETSGSLNILFTDKTGTLTEGKLKGIDFITGDLKSYNNYSDIKLNRDLLNISFIYNNSSFMVNGKCEGSNSTDKAILGFVCSDKRDEYKIINRKEFDSKNKYSSVCVDYLGESYFYKGAYEKIINSCSFYLDSDNNKKLLDKSKLFDYINKRTSLGQRVIAFSYSQNNTFNNMILIGVLFLNDNIRLETYDAIKNIKSAGIQVVMITGDSSDTAYSVAKELNIIDEEHNIVLTGEELSLLSDDELKNKLLNVSVVSRCLPKDKIRLVRVSQEMNLVVGMTGDGVNDAPALRKSNVGFSMGSGTEVSKETSDIVIIDNNIKSISYAILYGRTIFKSIRKFVIFQLSVNVCTVFLSIIGPFIGILSPITVIQVLWVNMVMDSFSGLAFAFEPALNEYMLELPKKLDDKIINSYMKNQIICNGIFSMIVCLWFLKSSIVKNIYVSDVKLLSAFFGLFIFLDIFNAFCARTHRINTFGNIFKNKIFLFIFILISIIQIILIYYGGELFRTTGLSFIQFEFMILVSFIIVPFDIIRKIILKKKNKLSGV